jgi:hypothetical protein
MIYIAADLPAFLLSLQIRVCIFYIGRNKNFKGEIRSISADLVERGVRAV